MNFLCLVFASILLSANLYSWQSYGDQTSSSDSELYRRACQKAAEDDLFFSQFKQCPDYRQILEHLGREIGELLLERIKQQTPEFLSYVDEFRKNDFLGTPTTDYFDGIGMLSSTTLRYIKVASDLKVFFGSLDNKSIVEIGGGYGGQCLILSKLCKFKSYTIVDLPEATALQKKYLERNNVGNVFFKSIEPHDATVLDDNNVDLVISNYAYDELTPEIRKQYLREIISYSKMGYMTGNRDNLAQHKVAEYLQKDGPICEEWAERPLTHAPNAILIWR